MVQRKKEVRGMQVELLSGDTDTLDLLAEQLARSGVRPWYAVISPFQSGVTDNLHLVRLCVEQIPPGGAGYCLFETESDALEWISTTGEQIGLSPPLPAPAVWAVYDGDTPGVYPSEEEAAIAAGEGGVVQGLPNHTWADIYASTGRYGLSNDHVDVRRCYARSWKSPVAYPPPSHYVHVWIEPTRWVRVFQASLGQLPDDAAFKDYTWNPDIEEKTQLSLVACQATASLLSVLWGELDSRLGGLFHPDDRVTIRIITNSADMGRLARGHTRNAVEAYMSRWFAACPAVLTVDPHDNLWPKK